ncbi:hypothetical protein SMICM17S_00992 [Streptomyces microflavus]
MTSAPAAWRILDEAGQRFAVQLEGDTAALDALAEEPVEDFGHRFGPG